MRQSDSRIKAQVEEALQADETLSGSRILVRSVTKQEAVKAHDDRVERAVTKALENRPELSDARIDVDVRNGVARLTGTVPTEQQRLTAALAARSVTGLKSVHDDLRVSRPPWPRPPEHGSFGWEESKR